MQKHTVTLCMIVKNEEKYLERCLKSVVGKVDEIIVVDTGSTDSTIEIAKKYNAVIKHFEWVDDFSAARNYSIKDVRTEYILILDADEYFDDSVDLQKDLAEDKDFYLLTIKNYQGGQLILYHQNIRLFKSGIGLYFSGKLHEHLNAYDKDSNYIGAESDIVIHHVGYMPDVVNEKNKKKRNYEIMKRELQENPTGFNYYNMGIVYMLYEEYDKALDMFKKSYPLSKDKKYIMGMLVRMGKCLDFLGRTEEGIGLLLDAVNVFPNYTDLHYTLAKLYQEYGYLRDAEIKFKKCIELGDRKLDISAEGVGSYMANYHLAVIYDMKGEIGDAFDEAYNAITKRKSFTPALSLYISIMQRTGIHPDQIMEHLSKVYRLDTVEELRSLIYSLYEIRHPLLGKYCFAYGAKNSVDIVAIARMLNKQYEASLEEWRKVDRIHEINAIDAAVMCLIKKDEQLMIKVKSCFNLSNRDWRTLSGILLNENIEKLSLTLDIEKILLDIGEYLIKTEEFEQFEYISRYLLQCSIDTQEKLASILLSYGHTDTVIELVKMIIDKYPRRFELNMIMGKAYMKQNRNKEAIEYFMKSLRIKKDYSAYEKIYDIYEKTGDKEKLSELAKVMKEEFPLSIWLKTI